MVVIQLDKPGLTVVLDFPTQTEMQPRGCTATLVVRVAVPSNRASRKLGKRLVSTYDAACAPSHSFLLHTISADNYAKTAYETAVFCQR